VHGGGGSQSGETPRQIRVFVLDDHELVRVGLKKLLAAEPDISVVGEAGTVRSALNRLPVLSVDVAVLDVRLPDGDGTEVARAIQAASPQTACLMLTAHTDDRALLAAIMAGAAGFLTKETLGPDLVDAVRNVAVGGAALGPEAAQRVMTRLRENAAAADPLSTLSSQERKVLGLVGEGLTNREIAGRMFLSEKTVKNYVSSLLAKLGMQRRAQAAALVARLADSRADG
jgi:two-component system, NarL family, response regulator DevR